MPAELYRTYEVLIEETVHPSHPKRGKTSKNDLYKPDIHHALCVTNDLYQDAMCYYTVLLAGLAGDTEARPGQPLNPLWRETAHERGKYRTEADIVVQRLAQKFKPLEGCRTAEDLRQRTLFRHHMLAGEKVQRFSQETSMAVGANTYRILEQKGVELGEDGTVQGCEDLSEFASGWASILCDPTGGTKIPGTGVFDLLQSELLREGIEQTEADTVIAKAFKAAHRSHRTSFVERFERELAECETEPKKKQKLERKRREYADFLKERLANARDTVEGALVKGVSAKASKLELAADEYNRHKANVSSLVGKLPKSHQLLRRLRYGERDNSFEAVVLRYWWVKFGPDAAVANRSELLPVVWKDLLAYVHDASKRPEVPPQIDGRPIVAMPYANYYRVAFPLFAKHCLSIPTDDRSPWWDFDKAAFATAAEDVFKYKIRSVKRQSEVEKLRSVKKAALEGIHFEEITPENSPTGKSIVVRGMKDDMRRSKMEKLLREMADEKGLDSYGLDSGTIGGWADVREKFLALERKNQATEQDLTAAVDECQTENRQGFGSADFFHTLCRPEYHETWSENGASADAAKFNGISDFVAYYTRYSEWIEDLAFLESEDGRGIKPISYTFPGRPNRHGELSQRHFNFKAELQTEFAFPKLFTHENTGFKLLSGEKVKLSARRLKRDRIVNGQGDSLGALWCPPLVVAEGDNRPRAGKWEGDRQEIDKISFSLMVEPDGECEFKPPVHLKVQIPLQWQEQLKLQRDEDLVRWGEKSLRGYAKKGSPDADKRRHWRWPVDLLTGFVAGEDDGSSSGARSFSSKKLWCGDGVKSLGDGFLVNSLSGKLNRHVPCFHILSVDLGNRFCAAFARLRVHAEDADAKTRGRTISPDNNWATPIYAQLLDKGTLRLQGEDAKIWQLGEDKPTKEPYGNDGRGRFPDDERDEKGAFLKLAEAILPLSNAPIRTVDTMTYPEMGDHLVWRFRRRLSRVRTLFKLRWLTHPESKNRNPRTGHYDLEFKPNERDTNRRKAVEMLAKFYSRPKREEDEQEDSVYESLRLALAEEAEWQTVFRKAAPATAKQTGKKSGKDKDVIRDAVQKWNIPESRWVRFRKELDEQLKSHLAGEAATAALLVQVVEWCLPLRTRHWKWHSHKDHPELEQGKKGHFPDHLPHIQGMRGLSLRRLEQVLNVRQLCQSYAKIERRWMQDDTGVNDLVIKRDEDLHDPCPDLLKKSNDLRKQRVYQTAHLILTEALGLELKNPAEVERNGKSKKELKSEIDLHGSYQPKHGKDGQPLPHCSVIVLEDLTRYRTSQERTRAENSRLMKWAHRAIVNKLADMAKPFGITIMLVDPSFSSRFDSRTGVAGIRVNEVSRGFENEMPYAAWAKRVKAGGKKDDLATQVEELAAIFRQHENSNRTLLFPVEGGKLFLPALLPIHNASDDGKEGLLNADENAAVNIGLRALAHPDRLDIFPRLRTKRHSGVARVRNRRGWFATLPPEDPGRELRKTGDVVSAPVQSQVKQSGEQIKVTEDEVGESSEFPDFFAVEVGRTSFPSLPAGDAHFSTNGSASNLPPFEAYQRPLFLKKVQEACLQRIAVINRDRLAGLKKPDEKDNLKF